MRDFRVCTRRSAAAVSLRPPFPPFVKGVRRAHVMTMSEGDFESRPARPREASDPEEKCDRTWERRWLAVDRNG